jgi:hypothetical protein
MFVVIVREKTVAKKRRNPFQFQLSITHQNLQYASN